MDDAQNLLPSAENGVEQGDCAGRCPKCDSFETHVSFEDITANYCRCCRSYWRPAPPAETGDPDA